MNHSVKNVPKALIVSPYLDHLGGGERYMLSVAMALEEAGYQLYFSWDNLEEISSLSAMLGITLRTPYLAPQIKDLYFARHPLAMFLATRPYDTVVYLSDGSIPLLGGRCNILHMQVPFHGVKGRSWQNQLKKRLIDHTIVNSQFTKKVIDREYGLSSKVIYPPVVPVTCRFPKENIILSVGRFEPSLNTKHQDVLIQAFRRLSPHLSGWKLVLLGASSADSWVDQLRTLARDLPVEFVVNASYGELCQLYARSRIYWHAAGYGVDELKNPELTEHFGISTVEAVSAGCLPLVVPYGGQREIIPDPLYHWTTIEELIAKTQSLALSQTSFTLDIIPYSLENFNRQIKKLSS